MNLEKLTPAPWDVTADTSSAMPAVVDAEGKPVAWVPLEAADLRHFIALARNAFDVMMRRGWWAIEVNVTTEDELPPFSKGHGKIWRVSSFCGPLPLKKFTKEQIAPDPFTALVEADRWYKENVEGK